MTIFRGGGLALTMSHALVLLFVLTLALSAAVVLGSILLALVLILPLSGALVRLRANYLPKAVSLENVLHDGQEAEAGDYVRGGFSWNEQRAAAKIGPVVNGVYGMLRRIVRLEGWRGLWKGITLQYIFAATMALVQVIIFGSMFIASSLDHMPIGAENPSPLAMVIYTLILAFCGIPIMVLTNRSVVHPRLLNWRSFRACLEEIMSPEELRQPWRLFVLPGVAESVVLRLLWNGVLGTAVRFLTFPSLVTGMDPRPIAPGEGEYSGPSSDTSGVSVIALIAYCFWLALSLVVLAPLDCITVRLSVQRPSGQQPLHEAYAAAPYNHQASVALPRISHDAPGDEADANEATPIAEPGHRLLTDMPEEPVIALRACNDSGQQSQFGFGAAPMERYHGVVDCARKMIDEEGFESIRRGFMFTLISIIITGV